MAVGGIEGAVPYSPSHLRLTLCSAIVEDLALGLVQPAARLAAQVGGEPAPRRHRLRPHAVTVRGVTLTHHGAMAEVSGQTPLISWKNTNTF